MSTEKWFLPCDRNAINININTQYSKLGWIIVCKLPGMWKLIAICVTFGKLYKYLCISIEHIKQSKLEKPPTFYVKSFTYVMKLIFTF